MNHSPRKLLQQKQTPYFHYDLHPNLKKGSLNQALFQKQKKSLLNFEQPTNFRELPLSSEQIVTHHSLLLTENEYSYHNTPYITQSVFTWLKRHKLNHTISYTPIVSEMETFWKQNNHNMSSS